MDFSGEGGCSVSAVIPAYNEAERIGDVILRAKPFVDEVVVVDDGSSDETSAVAESAGARVIHQDRAGYIAGIRLGFREAQGEVVVTMDADGEHRPEDIPRLLAPIAEGRADLVLGRRQWVPRRSERVLNWLTRLRVGQVYDTGTGFRAIRRELALQLELRGRCICGVSVLEAVSLGARLAQVPVESAAIDKPRRIAWFHMLQVFYVLAWLFTGRALGN
jgi:hypothetical protein